MSKISLIVLSIALGLVIFVIGGGMGIVYQSQIPASTDKNSSINSDCSSLINVLSSDLVSIINIYGKVTSINIENGYIALSLGDNNLVVKVKDNTRISLLTEMGTIRDIKTGDYLSVMAKLLSDGTIEAKSISVSSFLKSSK